MKLLNTLSILALATTLNVGCGSDGGGSAGSPNGIYTGSITGGRGAPFNGDEKGVIYNNKMMVFSSANGIRQMFESQVTQSGSTLSGTIIYHPADSAPSTSSLTLSGSFVADTSATINFTDATGSQPPDGTINLISNPTSFNKGSSSATILATWQGLHGGVGNGSTIMVSATGAITGSSDLGCTYTGTILPADTNINIYDVNLITGSDCDDSIVEFLAINTTYTGFAWTEGVNDEILNFAVSDGTNSRFMVLTKN